MSGQNELYNHKNLEDSKCHIGLRNPNFRVSDERFCASNIQFGSKLFSGVRKYNINSLVNIFLIGFGNFFYLISLVCGIVFSLLLWISTKVTFKKDVDNDIENPNMKTAQRMEFIELTDSSISGKQNHQEEFKVRDDDFDSTR